VAAAFPDVFVPVASVHPYRKDALQQLQHWADKVGAPHTGKPSVSDRVRSCRDRKSADPTAVSRPAQSSHRHSCVCLCLCVCVCPPPPLSLASRLCALRDRRARE
jgi:hypothetical protein